MELKVEGFETVFVPDLDKIIKVSFRASRIAISAAFTALDPRTQELYFVWLGFKLKDEEMGIVAADLLTIDEMLKRYPDTLREFWKEQVLKIRFL